MQADQSGDQQDKEQETEKGLREAPEKATGAAFVPRGVT
jgi:hypothetical protein